MNAPTSKASMAEERDSPDGAEGRSPTQSTLRVIVGQMTSVDDWKSNEEQALGLLSKIKDPKTVDLVSFPENSLFLRLNEKEKMQSVDLSDPIFTRLSKFAIENKLTIHLGSVPLTAGKKVYNATVLIGPDGKCVDAYNKIHLFDVDISGHRAYRESDTVEAGDKPSIIEIEGWKFGLTICYDLRFSNLYAYYARAGVDGILVPAAFTVPTGKAHWEVLQRARAIECQCFVIAAAQDGSHNGKRETYGHSLVVDPWGHVLAVHGPGQGILDVTLDRAVIERVRSQIPMARHRKGPFDKVN
ncbi:MAG: carbon-nitrogen hydrolase family protein [Bdellovibrionia bacterium]